MNGGIIPAVQPRSGRRRRSRVALEALADDQVDEVVSAIGEAVADVERSDGRFGSHKDRSAMPEHPLR